ncbi:MAG: hypothetical protein A2189_02780 [Paenibacillus sp. RIFOXYA1_FULL_44_5]|nr:MAG: hypothetical protein A2189_02780 [Paenibacillus sp. RIFOXYA1_FULL_44_5]
MKYTGRMIIVTISLVCVLIARVYGNLYYNYPTFQFPILGISFVIIFWWLGGKYDQVKFLSEKDALTKVYNRRFVVKVFPKLAAIVNKKDEKLSLFLLDVDNFKTINDTYGHRTGDKVLQHISSLLLRITRKNEIVARWAGDEFLIVAPFTGKNGKGIIIDLIKKELMKVSVELNMNVTVSVGISVYPDDGENFEELFHVADQNMYMQKRRRLENNPMD